MGKITFILGGARSGKSSYAIQSAKKYRRVAFIATCCALDTEMRVRISRHKKTRPDNWRTFEEPLNVSFLVWNLSGQFDMIILDCLTLFISNLMLERKKEEFIE